MKTCPVCKARTFDDAEVCYGCMHRFGSTPTEVLADAGNWEPEEGLGLGQLAAHEAKTLVGSPAEERRVAGHAALVEVSTPTKEGASGEEGVRSEGRHAAERARCPDDASAQEPRRRELTRRDAQPVEGALRRSTRVDPVRRARRDSVPFDGAGWIVRFELPGALHEAQEGLEYATREAYLADAHAVERGRAGSLVISIEPATGAGGREAERAELAAAGAVRALEPAASQGEQVRS